MDGFSWNRERPGDEIHWLKCTRDKQNLAWRNSWRFATPPLVFPRSDVWGTSAEIPYSHPHFKLLYSHQILSPYLGCASDWFSLWASSPGRSGGEASRRACSQARLVLPRGKLASTTQKHYPDLGNNTSSVWEFLRSFLTYTSFRKTSGGYAKCRLFIGSLDRTRKVR